MAFMLFVPMLYTDVTEAWRITDRRQRLHIGAAGILAELTVACWSLLLWNFLPDGAMRSVVFVWASSTWVLTLMVNMNPLMRFDGYYILSDALDEPNLQDTSFRLARWHLRTHAFGLHEQPSTHHAAPRRRLLVAYAYATWVYRLLLFLGIALVVYTMALKLLGILLALVEVGWFIVRPVAAEVRQLWTRRRDLRPNLAMVRSAAFVVAVTAIMAVPWRGTVHGDALVGAERRAMLFAPAASQVVEITAAPGMRAVEGQSLLRLHSPSLAHEAAQLRQAVESLTLQVAAHSSQQDSAARAHLLGLERETVRKRLASTEAAIAQLDLRAPFTGEVVELADPLQRLEWVERGEPLALVVDRASTLAEALVSEQDLRRIAVSVRRVFRLPTSPTRHLRMLNRV